MTSAVEIVNQSLRRSPIGSAREAGYIPASSAIGPYLCIEPGRLAAAAYNGCSMAGDYSTSYSYDANSNLTGITRRAIEGFPGDNAFMPGGTIYALDGNQVTVRLQRGSGAFRPLMNNAVVTDFRQVYYDACGRMVRDNDKGISKIAYNELHLPYSIERVGESTNHVTYGVQYAADGRKLRTGVLGSVLRTVPVNGIDSGRGREPVVRFETTTDYVGNLVYKNGILEKVLVDGGYITAADMRYHFFVTDHLGNVRVVVNDAGVVEQVNQFYPYGESTDMGQGGLDSVDNPYKWSGKEWDEDQGTYDFGARMYSASDARWTTMDPLSEKYYHISPYAYCAGNPVNLVDPDGMQWYSYTDKDGNTKYQYWEGEMPEDEQAKYNNIQYLDYTYLDKANNTYYSLFGRELSWVDSEGRPNIGQIYDVIDRLIIQFATDNVDSESGIQKMVTTTIKGLPFKEYRGFSYNGRTFKTVPLPANSWSTDGDVFRNSMNQSAGIDCLPEPGVQVENRAFQKGNPGHWLKATNPSKGGKRGFQVVALKFNETSAAGFRQSYCNIFGVKSYWHL